MAADLLGFLAASAREGARGGGQRRRSAGSNHARPLALPCQRGVLEAAAEGAYTRRGSCLDGALMLACLHRLLEEIHHLLSSPSLSLPATYSGGHELDPLCVCQNANLCFSFPQCLQALSGSVLSQESKYYVDIEIHEPRLRPFLSIISPCLKCSTKKPIHLWPRNFSLGEYTENTNITMMKAWIFKLEETDSLIHEIIKPMAAPFVILPSQHACQIRLPHTAWNRWLYLAFVVAGMSMLYIAIVSTVWPSEQLTEVCSPTLFLCFQWWYLLEKFGCSTSKLHLKPWRFRTFVVALVRLTATSLFPLINYPARPKPTSSTP